MLAEREARVHKFTIRELPATERAGYADEWAAVQRRFVDDPSMAVSEADRLVNRVMNARGYPMADFDQRADDLSVSYPGVVQNYRSAREIFVRHSSGLNRAAWAGFKESRSRAALAAGYWRLTQPGGSRSGRPVSPVPAAGDVRGRPRHAAG